MSHLNDVSFVAAPSAVFEYVWNMQLVKSAQSRGIVEEWVVVVAVAAVVVVVAHSLAVVLIQVTAALHATSVVIIRMTAHVLVELVLVTDARSMALLFLWSLTQSVILISSN